MVEINIERADHLAMQVHAYWDVLERRRSSAASLIMTRPWQIRFLDWLTRGHAYSRSLREDIANLGYDINILNGYSQGLAAAMGLHSGVVLATEHVSFEDGLGVETVGESGLMNRGDYGR